MKSTSSYLFMLGSGAFAWNSKNKVIMTQSTAEVKFIAVVVIVNQAIWLRKSSANLKKKKKKTLRTTIHSTIYIYICFQILISLMN